ncbi:MAG: NUDIX hydrolase domain-like protein [Monoraphidium minutum]|nr:MAG: NUDIX hydrolase domain-like protein [Monoraphidium minutum]
MTGAAAARAPAFMRRVLAGSGSDVKLLTLAVVRQDNRLLLGRKKRGFGEGYVNGFGGKVEAGEGIEAAAAREIEEEAGVVALGLKQRGVLTFVFDDQPLPWEVHVFTANGFKGEPCETDEMRPEWFDASMAAIPFDQMWADDRYWWPLLLRADEPSFQGLFGFTATHTLAWWRLREAPAGAALGDVWELLPPGGEEAGG